MLEKTCLSEPDIEEHLLELEDMRHGEVIVWICDAIFNLRHCLRTIYGRRPWTIMLLGEGREATSRRSSASRKPRGQFILKKRDFVVILGNIQQIPGQPQVDLIRIHRTGAWTTLKRTSNAG